MPKKKEVEEEEVTCPVCGKPVGLEVPSCPYCGAEFEEEGEAEAESTGATEEETAECPVCGKAVSLTVSACPNCGAEFEEEGVEEVIEVEEEVVPKKAAAKAPPAEEEKAVVEEEVEVEEEAHVAKAKAPASIMDLRVIGIALVILGIIGSQIAFMIDWYWSWVPPIEDNVGLFVTIPLVVIVVGLLLFMLIRNALAAGKRVPMQMPGASLSMFLFGIFALVVMLLYKPINDALQSSQAGVGGAFVILLVVGILIVIFGMRFAKTSESA
ncbi:MAG: hypothetical protein ACUVT7_04105 [Thermoplasmata archaeon]